MEFQAALLMEAGRPLQIADVRLDRLGDDDVLVKIGAAGLCHTDYEAMAGSFAAVMPIILGHEGAGTIVDVGRNVQRSRIGESVVFSIYPSCGHCFYCSQAQPILCAPVGEAHQSGSLPDSATRLTLAGERVHHFLSVSSFAGHCVVPAAGAIALPEAIGHDVACLLGCAVMTGVGAVTNVADLQAGNSVAVVGCGAVGLSAVQGARLRDASVIAAIDTNADRRSMALRFGATHAFDPRDGDAVERIRALTHGRGADAVFEAAGRPDALRTSLEMTRRGGITVILGKLPPNDMVELRFGSLMGEKRIVRSSLGGARPQDFRRLADAHLRGDLLLDEMITERIVLGEINEGFERLAAGSTIRSVIVMGGVAA